MNTLKKMLKTPQGILKLLALLFLGVAVIVTPRLFGIDLLPFDALTPAGNSRVSFDRDMGMSDYAEESMYNSGAPMVQDGIMPNPKPFPPVEPEYPAGENAEAFEVTEYYASIETNAKEKPCAQIADLKSRSDVIFQNSYEYEDGCNYSFKVANSAAPEIVSFLEKLSPRDLSENTYTIQQQLEYYETETDILKKKQQSLIETLENAETAYDEITELATNTRDAESLSRIIASKLELLERLSQQRIAVTEQLNRLQKSQQEQLDRLSYTFFSIQVFEHKYVDGSDLKDSWKHAVQRFFRNLNQALQGLTLFFVVFLVQVLQWALYFFVVVFVAKYCWRWAKEIWGENSPPTKRRKK